MKNLKVSLKLLVGFGASAVFLLLVGVVSIVSLYELNDEYNDAVTDHALPLGDAAQVLESIHSIRAETRGGILFTGERNKIIDIRNEIEKQFKQFEEASGRFGKAFDDHPEAKVLFTEAMDKYEKVFKQSVHKILDGAEKDASKESLMAEMVANANPAVDLVSANMRKCMEMDLHELNNSTEKGSAWPYGLLLSWSLLPRCALPSRYFWVRASPA